MTTDKARRYMLALILPLLLLAVGCNSQSVMVDPEPTEVSTEAFMIRSAQVAVNPTTLEGTFEVFGAIDDHGASQEVLTSAEPLYKLTGLSGQKILEGQQGTITIKFFVGLSATDQNTLAATGGFSIVEGTGAYTGLRGSGKIDSELDRNASAAALTEILEGEAWYVQ